MYAQSPEARGPAIRIEAGVVNELKVGAQLDFHGSRTMTVSPAAGSTPPEPPRAGNSSDRHPGGTRRRRRQDTPGGERTGPPRRAPLQDDRRGAANELRIAARRRSARRSTSVKAKLSVLPSFQPNRANTPLSPSSATGCSTLSPKPVLWRPARSSAAMAGAPPGCRRDRERLVVDAHGCGVVKEQGRRIVPDRHGERVSSRFSPRAFRSDPTSDWPFAHSGIRYMPYFNDQAGLT